MVVRSVQRRWQSLSLSAEEHHQVRNAPVINVGVGPVAISARRGPFVGVGAPVRQHVIVNLLLQIEAHRSICSDHFVRTHARRRGNISVWVRNSNIGWVVPDHVVRAFDRRRNKRAKEFFFSL
jgi:hypothetical protein